MSLQTFANLTPTHAVDMVEHALGTPVESFVRPCTSHINRVYEMNTRDGLPFIAKFYRPGRWTEAAIRDEHDFMLDCQDAEIPVVAPAAFADGDKRLPEILGDRLRERGLTLATAESCTGGNIAHQITSIAGSSDYFKGAVVSYANEVKTALLGVSEQDLIDHGAVSEPVVQQMAEGVCRALGTDCGIATSGIAGPGGGTPDKPVGTVWMAAKCGDRVVAQVKQLPGDRDRVITRATLEAQLLLLSLL